MKRILFKINGIRNNTEKVQLKKALDKIDGVVEISIDPIQSSVEVAYNPPATNGVIQDCIENTGHETTVEKTEE